MSVVKDSTINLVLRLGHVFQV